VTARSESQLSDAPSADLMGCLRDLSSHLVALPYESSSTYSIGSFPIQFQFGRNHLEQRICRAFEHLATEPHASASLTLAIHTCASAPRVRGFDLSIPQPSAESDVWLFHDFPWTFIVQRNGHVLCGIDLQKNRGWWFTAEANEIPYLERAAPLKQLLSLWLAEQGIFLVHAAAVGTDRGGALILGCGGSGKSTTSIVCALGGMIFAADDHCLVELDTFPKVHSLYSTAKLAIADTGRFPVLQTALKLDGRPDTEKEVFLLQHAPGVMVKRELLLRKVLLARIAHESYTRIRTATHAEAFKTLAPSCALHFPAHRMRALQCYSALIRQVPVYVLELGNDFARIPETIREFLDQ
jgi:hypothetical protein